MRSTVNSCIKWEQTLGVECAALGLLLSLIYISDLADNLSVNPKLFADDTSLFL